MTDAEQFADETTENKNIWMRGLMMLIFAFFFAVAETVLVVVAIVQFFWTVFDKRPNEALSSFGESLSTWLAQVAKFQTFATEEKPFPWAKWPSEDKDLGPLK